MGPTFRSGNTALHTSCVNGLTEIVELLLQEGDAQQFVNASNRQGSAPLHLAVTQCHSAIIELLIQYGANVNQWHQTSGETPLFMAAVRNDLPTCRILVEHGRADPNAGHGWKVPLVEASERGLYQIVEYLLQQPNMDVGKVQTLSGASALRAACEHGHSRTVRLLIEKGGAHVEAVDEMGNTALLAACLPGSKSNLDVVRYLVESARANIRARNKKGWTALLLTTQGQDGNLDVFRYLMENEASGVHLNDDAVAVNTVTGRNVLHEACAAPHIRKINYLMTHPVGHFWVYKTDKEGRTPLHYAAERGVAACKWLLTRRPPTAAPVSLSHAERRVLLNRRDHEGRTPLHGACNLQKYKVVEYLVVHCGAQVNGTHDSRAAGDTILHVAVNEAIEELDSVKEEASITKLANPDKFPAYHIVHLLVEKGHANIVDVNRLSETCLILVEDSAPWQSFGKQALYKYLQSTQNNRVHSLVHYLNSTFDWFNSSTRDCGATMDEY